MFTRVSECFIDITTRNVEKIYSIQEKPNTAVNYLYPTKTVNSPKGFYLVLFESGWVSFFHREIGG